MCRWTIAPSQTTVLILWFVFFPGVFIKWLHFCLLRDAACLIRADGIYSTLPWPCPPCRNCPRTGKFLPVVSSNSYFVLPLYLPHHSSAFPEVLLLSHLGIISALYWKPQEGVPVPSQDFPRLPSVHPDLKSMGLLTTPQGPASRRPNRWVRGAWFSTY